MKLIDRHLLRENLVPLFYSLLGFSMLHVVVGMFELAPRMFDGGLPVSQMVVFFLNYLVAYTDGNNMSFLILAMPVSILAGSQYSLFKLTRHNEIMAMRAGGVSPLRAMRPFLAVGVALLMVAVLVQELVAPAASLKVDQMRHLYLNQSDVNPYLRVNHKYYNSAAGRRWGIREFDMRYPGKLTGVQVTLERADVTREAIVRADRAAWRNGAWRLYGCSLQKFGLNDEPAGPVIVPEQRVMDFPEFTETPMDLLVEADARYAARYSSTWKYLMYIIAKGNPPAKALADAHMRLAMPFACLVIALISVPMGMKNSARNASVSIVGYAVFALFAYYAVVELGLVLGEKAVITPWLGAWIPNLVFFVVGLIMICKVR